MKLALNIIKDCAMKMYGEAEAELHAISILALDMPKLLTPVLTGLALRWASEHVQMLWRRDKSLSLPEITPPACNLVATLTEQFQLLIITTLMLLTNHVTFYLFEYLIVF